MKAETMRSWITSQMGAVVLFAVLVMMNLALLLPIVANGRGLQSERSVAASLLIGGTMLFLVAGYLFTGRAFLKWPVGEAPAYLRVERSFIIAAVLVNTLGLALLENLLRDAGQPILARLGMVTYLIGAVVVVVAEAAFAGKREWNYAQVVVYVVLAYLAQAAFGVALLQTGLVPGWIGWATILWNLAWLVVLPITRPHDVYFPVLHHVAPLLIGIALLMHV